METVGSKLSAAREAAGKSLREVASEGGWTGASSVQKYFEPGYDRGLRTSVAERFARSLGDIVWEIMEIEPPPPAPTGRILTISGVPQPVEVIVNGIRYVKEPRP